MGFTICAVRHMCEEGLITFELPSGSSSLLFEGFPNNWLEPTLDYCYASGCLFSKQFEKRPWSSYPCSVSYVELNILRIYLLERR